jgi:ATP-binding cassette subfamily A (ABC1) protein 3
MALGSHLSALLRKNWLLWRRSLRGSLCEVLSPVFLVMILLFLRFALPPETKSAKSYLDDGQIIAPVNVSAFEAIQVQNNWNWTTDPFKWCRKNIEYGWEVAFVLDESDKTEKALANEINTQLNQYYLQGIDEARNYSSNSKLKDYVTDSDYEDDDTHKVCFAVYIDEFTNKSSGVTLDYTLRYNSTDTDPDEQTVYGKWYEIFATNGKDAVNKFQQEVDTGNQHDFMESGFVQLQNMIHNYILRSIYGPDAYIAVAFVPMHGHKYVQDDFVNGFSTVLGFFMFITSLIPVVRLISRICTEKETKVREAMKMMGLTDTPYWLSWYIMYLVIYTFIAVVCTLICIPIFRYASKFVVFLMFFIYGLTCIGFSFLIAAFCSKSKTGIFVGVVVFFVSYFALFGITDTTPQSTKQGISLFNTAAMAQGFNTLLTFEGAEISIKFSNLDETYEHYSVQDSIIFMSIDAVLYILLALYFDKVIPSEYGVSLPWYFPFTKSFWRGHKAHDNALADNERALLNEEAEDRKRKLVELNVVEEPENALKRQIETEQAMVVRNLRKHFGTKVAVDSLDLDIFEGQIFALLGHNGAGKTTTISMLTGLLEPSGGDVSVQGLNFRTDMPDIRKRLGVCPQHDVLFLDLTVEEHLLLFCRFKGMTDVKQIQTQVDEKIEAIDLKDKRNTPAKNLSGGQKRKLSLAIALIGGSTVVVLDEPTSGMDLTARRRMWDMLKNEKARRIIILTTHYMEEADILADRIAIMAEGKLVCLGSPLFLKKRFGVGYNLVIAKKRNVASPQHSRFMVELIKKHVAHAKLLSDVSAEISFQLPLSSSNLFSELLNELDQRLNELELENYSISVTTLEEVFIRVARGDSAVKKTDSFIDAPKSAYQPPEGALDTGPLELATEEQPADLKFNLAENRTKSWRFFVHSGALIKKRVINSIRDYKGLLLEIILPIIVVMAGLALLTQFAAFTNEESWDEKIDQYDSKQSLMYNNNPFSQYNLLTASDSFIQEIMEDIEANNKGDVSLKPENITDLEKFDKKVYDDRDHDPFRMGSYYFYKNNQTAHQYEIIVFQNSSAFQSIPTFYEAVAQSILENALSTDVKLELTNHPLPLTKKQSKLAQNAGTFFASMIFGVGMAFIPTGIVAFIVKEKEVKIKHQHIVSGVSIAAYWLSSYLWDLIKHAIVASVCSLMVLGFDLQSLTDNSDVYATTWLLFALFGVAMAPFTYLTSFLFESYAMAQFTTFIFNLMTGAVLATMSWILRIINDNTRDVIDVLMYPFRLSPIYCFTFGLMNISNRDTYESAYGQSHLRGPLDWQIAGADVTFLAVEAVVYFAMVFIIERLRTISSLRLCGRIRDPGEALYIPDDDVEAEKKRARVTDPNEVAVKCYGLRQVYGTKTDSLAKVAVEDVSFLVNNQECFALLGVNGAGKTSTFRILTGEYAPTQGEAYIAGRSVLTELAEARYSIGYCPQFDALSELLTPIEHLELYARIKGIPSNLVNAFARQKMTEMGLSKYEKVRAGSLSGGNKRKLSVAMACIGNPPVVFLDEPSAGMDPDARKNMWIMINAIKSRKTSIILTTHSMDEAEALCDRIVIMVAGRNRCLGTPSHIKSKFGSGYEFMLKVRQPEPAEIARGIDMIRSCVQNEEVKEASVYEALQLLGNAAMMQEVTERGMGKAIYQELKAVGGVNAEALVEWYMIEQFGERIFSWLNDHFEHSKLLEHYNTYYKFKLEKQPGQTLAFLFGTIEASKNGLDISEYSLSQTTLEQIFNMFATESEFKESEVRMTRTHSAEHRAT